MVDAGVLARRKQESSKRLLAVRKELASELDPINAGASGPKVCIYATGSLARLEATDYSDLDAFFLLTGNELNNPLSRIRDVRILNAVVNVSERCGFPDFSNEGEYLKFLHIDDMLAHIGGRGDDYHNAFTGRILMILEGKSLYDDGLFQEFRQRVVETYFKDFHDHSTSFRPIFLLNDVLRFWRTLCINYENSRHWRERTTEKSARGHLDNLKLRFSRLNICYSFVCHLLAKGEGLSPDDVLDTASLTPLERLIDLRDDNPTLGTEIDALLDEYAWFSESVGREKTEVLSWISDLGNREAAFAHGDRFVETMSTLVRRVAEEHSYLRFLLI